MIQLPPAKVAFNASQFGSTGPRKMVLRQDQSPGDILTFTRALCDLKDAYPHFELDVDTPCPEIFQNNPHLTPLDASAEDVEYHQIRYDTINESGWRGHHFADGFRIAVEQSLGVVIPSRGLRPQLFISDLEKSWYSLMHCEWGWDGPVWAINAGRKPDNALKQYHLWPEVADCFNARFQGEVRLVQIGHPDHIHPPLPGVMNAVGKTNDLRQLIRLLYHAAGVITPISFPFVVAAAFEQPCVVVAGAKEGRRWHVYNHVRWIDRNGCLPCALSDGCWKGGVMGECVDLVGKPPHPRCFDLITPKQIVDEVELYYRGGRLKR